VGGVLCGGKHIIISTYIYIICTPALLTRARAAPAVPARRAQYIHILYRHIYEVYIQWYIHMVYVHTCRDGGNTFMRNSWTLESIEIESIYDIICTPALPTRARAPAGAPARHANSMLYMYLHWDAYHLSLSLFLSLSLSLSLYRETYRHIHR